MHVVGNLITIITSVKVNNYKIELLEYNGSWRNQLIYRFTKKYKYKAKPRTFLSTKIRFPMFFLVSNLYTCNHVRNVGDLARFHLFHIGGCRLYWVVHPMLSVLQRSNMRCPMKIWRRSMKKWGNMSRILRLVHIFISLTTYYSDKYLVRFNSFWFMIFITQPNLNRL